MGEEWTWISCITSTLFMDHFKGTLHFNIDLGSRDSLYSPELRDCIKIWVWGPSHWKENGQFSTLQGVWLIRCRFWIYGWKFQLCKLFWIVSCFNHRLIWILIKCSRGRNCFWKKRATFCPVFTTIHSFFRKKTKSSSS